MRPEYLRDVHVLQLDLAQQVSDPRRNAASGILPLQAGGGALWAGRAWGARWSTLTLTLALTLTLTRTLTLTLTCGARA